MRKQRKYGRLDRTGPSNLEVLYGDFRGWCNMMANITHAEQRILYSGEYSRTSRRRLMALAVRRQWFLYQHNARDRARKEFEAQIANLRLLRRRD
jgi:hypothetical protein